MILFVKCGEGFKMKFYFTSKSQGRNQTLTALKAAGQRQGEGSLVTWVHINGKTLCVTNEPERSKRGNKKQGSQLLSSNTIVAPMPGKVTKIMVSEGDLVTQGQTIVVMEAMKMEYSIKSSGSYIVHSIPCKLNDQVKMGELLVQLKEVEK